MELNVLPVHSAELPPDKSLDHLIVTARELLRWLCGNRPPHRSSSEISLIGNAFQVAANEAYHANRTMEIKADIALIAVFYLEYSSFFNGNTASRFSAIRMLELRLHAIERHAAKFAVEATPNRIFADLNKSIIREPEEVIKILEFLNRQSVPRTQQKIADATGFSARTISTYIKDTRAKGWTVSPCGRKGEAITDTGKKFLEELPNCI